MSRGFSLIEVLVALALVCILSAVCFFYLASHERLFKPDDQILKIIDTLQEARQRSLTQRETMRVEIDLTSNVVRLIDENEAATVDDDREVRRMVLISPAEVKISERPPDISVNPPETMPVPIAQFRPSLHPASAGHNVCTVRFLRNGTAADAGSDALGSNAATNGLTLFVWSPKKEDANQSEIARAVTIVGATGSVRLWEYQRELSGETNKWKDSRRTGVYGGGQTSIGGTGAGNSNAAN